MASNFSFLGKNPQYNSFSGACSEAERSIAVSPATTAILARRALELAVKWLYSYDRDLKVPYQDNLSSLIHERSEEHTSELQSRPHLVCRLLLEKKKSRAPRVTAPALSVRCARRQPWSYRVRRRSWVLRRSWAAVVRVKLSEWIGGSAGPARMER